MIVGILEQGFIYAIIALGIYISYRIFDFPDMTVEGSFTFGAAVNTILIINGANPILALIIAFICGALAGLCTGIIHVKLGVRELLSGIVVMMSLYSINLRIVGKSNISISKYTTIFNNEFINNLNITKEYNKLIIIFLVLIIIKVLLDLYLKTRSGYLLKATGENQNVVTTLAKDSGKTKILGLMITNAFVALAGGVLCQHQKFFDITMGNGIMLMRTSFCYDWLKYI